MENNKKLRQKLKEEIDCLSKLNKLKKEVGDLNVESLLAEKKNIERKKETLYKEVFLYLFCLDSNLKQFSNFNYLPLMIKCI